MEGNKHYIRVVAGIVVRRFSDAFLIEAGGNEEILPGDICVNEDGGRQYNDPWTNGRGQYIYRWDGTDQVPRSEAELGAELAARPPAPETNAEKIASLETESVDTMLALTEVYETTAQHDTSREQENVDTMLALTEVYDMILQLQSTIDTLNARIVALEGGVS